jgi:methylenetetrahydrofolate dehydrogenase (NADP+)/methenyltetrahydrofolate cyclohydrolase
MANVLKGKEVVAAMKEKMIADVEALGAKGVTPTLGIIRIGERPDDISYEKGATKRCAEVGVAVKQYLLPETATQDELLKVIDEVNNDKNVHGVLLFRPLPKGMDDATVRRALAPEKDIDGITDLSLAGVFTGTELGFAPCTAQACIEIIDHFGIDVKGKNAVVIGRSLVIGKPVAQMLLAKNATVTTVHTKSTDMAGICSKADIIIASAGKAGVVGPEFAAPGQTIIDVGINWDEEKGKIVGDVNFDAVEPIVENITPVPGGVGSVTTLVLVKHVVEAAKRTLK